MAARSMRERLRKRREETQETLMDQDDEIDEREESRRTISATGLIRTTGPDPNMTWDAAVAELNATTGSELSDQEVVEEIRNAETLQEDLKTKHLERKRELKKSLRARREADVRDELRTAKEKSRDKLARSQRLQQDRDGTSDMRDGASEETIEAAEAATAAAEFSLADMSRRGSQEPLVDSLADGDVSVAKAVRKNLNATIRERLRSKIKSAREKAESEALEEQASKRRLRGLRDVPTATRFDDANVEERAASLMKVRWKRVTEKVIESKKDARAVSAEEAMDFFCRDWEPEPDMKPSVTSVVISETDAPKPSTSTEGAATADVEKIEETPESDKKKGKKKTDDEEALLGLDEVNEAEEWGYTAIRKAEYTSYKKKQEKERNEFYVPSMVAIPDGRKIDEKLKPRYLADEGIYVGKRPAISYRNENKLEDRLLHEPNGMGRKWFGEDGRVQILPDPLKKTPTRPMMIDESNPLLETIFFMAFDGEYMFGHVPTFGERYQLDFDLNNVTFSHHHLFSREHVLAARLRSLYTEYRQRSRNDIVNYYSERLQALKLATSHLRTAMYSRQADERPGHSLVDQERRLYDYSAEIRMVRQERDSHQAHDRQLMKNIIKTWKEIKSLRNLQRSVNTTVKLQIRREEVERASEEQDWLDEITDEVEELRVAYLQEFRRKRQDYDQLVEQRRLQQMEKKDAKKRQKKRERKKVEDMTHEEQEEEIRDQHITTAPDIQLPDPPVVFNEAETREIITSKAKRIRRSPGEPKLYPDLSEDATLTPIAQCPRGERERREDVNKYRIFAKVFVNNKEVARTVAKPLGQDFTVSFAQILNIQIVFWPESVRLEIYETERFVSDMISELYLAIPEPTVTSLTVQLEQMDFSSEQVVAHRHDSVGSGCLFTFDAEGTNMISLMTTGQVAASVCWAVHPDTGAPMVPPIISSANAISSYQQYDALAALGAAGSVDMDKLSKWIAEARLDPNDPRNADLVYLMKPVGGPDDAAIRLPDYFRLEQLQQEFDFVSDQQLESDLRFRLIQYRDQEVTEFRNYKMIPPYARDIPLDIFKEYEKKQLEMMSDRIRDIESHRAQVQRFMQKFREQVLRRFRILSHQRTFSSMVVEEDVPQIDTLIPILLKLIEAKRPLRPIRRERKKVTAQSMVPVKILVNIIRAYDVPVRLEAISTDIRQPKNRKRMDMVKPTIEILFQHETYSTTVADGPNPSWNEEIQIAFRPPNDDLSPSNLQTVKDVFYFNLFDYVEVDVLEDDRLTRTNIHRRIERRYLGNLKIPFSTLYLNSKIEGTFRVNMPPVLLGYTHQTKNTRIDSTGLGGDIEIGIGETDQAYLTLFITIEPQLSLPEPSHEKFDTMEDEKLLEAADLWQYDLEQKFPKRQFRTTVTDIQGRSVFATRYFRALKPPDDVVRNQALKLSPEDRVARYVSLIPFVADSLVFPGLCDIWSTCDQFMNMLSGDEEEHAVLLNNYFMDLGKRTWLVIGTAIPEGPTAYVLTEEGKDFWLWNASTGEHFSYKNNYCPLKSIGCVMNESNIWANIQQAHEPWRMSFDFSNSIHWKPFFTTRFPHPGLASVQPSSLEYLTTEVAYVGDLQDKIERVLCDKFMGWRPRNITRWNRYSMQALRQLLVRLEENGGGSFRNQPMPELDQILKTYTMTGFPMNMPFTEIEPIVDSVYSTGLHDLDSNEVEFALAVYICPYPNSILSVWVYVASLVRKR